MAVGIIAYWLLPDFPRSGPKSWLTEQEQRYAEFRLAISINNEVDELGGVKAGLKAAVSDIKVWALVFIQVCILSSQTWTYFFPTIVKTLGYGKIETLLLTAPVYVFGFITSMGNALVAQRTGHRAVLIMWPLTLDIIGNVMVVSSHHTAVRFTGMFFMCAGSFSAFNVIQAWIGSTIPRTRTKRAVSYAMVNMIGNLSNIYGAYFFPSSSSPQFIPGGIALSSFAFCGTIAAASFALYLRHLNKKATKEEDLDGQIRYKYIY
jgi:hypothetical protein